VRARREGGREGGREGRGGGREGGREGSCGRTLLTMIDRGAQAMDQQMDLDLTSVGCDGSRVLICVMCSVPWGHESKCRGYF